MIMLTMLPVAAIANIKTAYATGSEAIELELDDELDVDLDDGLEGYVENDLDDDVLDEGLEGEEEDVVELSGIAPLAEELDGSEGEDGEQETFVCSIGTVYYESFDAAILDAVDTDVIVLLDNIDYFETLVIDGISITIETNGFTLDVQTVSGDGLRVLNGVIDLDASAGGAFNVAAPGIGVYTNDGYATCTTVSGGNYGIYAEGGEVNVFGCVSVAGPSAAHGVYAANGAAVTVSGGVTSARYGIQASGLYTAIVVYGDVVATTSYGIYATSTDAGPLGMSTSSMSRASVTVSGDVISAYSFALRAETAVVTVSGNVSCPAGLGIYAESGSDVNIGGNVTCNTYGVYNLSSIVNVEGDVYGGSTGVLSQRAGSETIIPGNLGSRATGASISAGALLMVDGIIDVPKGSAFIKLNNVTKTIDDMVASVDYPGYLEVEASDSIVLLKMPAADLVQYKADAIDALNSYVNLVDYFTDQQDEIIDIIADYTALINGAASISGVDTIFAEATGLIDGIPTAAQMLAAELLAYKAGAINALNNYVDLADYLDDQQDEIIDIIADYTALINGAVSISDVDMFFAEATGLIGGIQTAAQMLAAELLAYKTGAIEALNEYVDLADYLVEQQAEIIVIIADYTALICEAESIADVDLLVAAATSLIDGVLTADQRLAAELLAYKADAIIALNDYVDLADYLDDQQDEIIDIIADYTALINGANSISEVDTIFAEATGLIDDVLTAAQILAAELLAYKTDAIDYLNDYVDLADYLAEQQAEIIVIIADYTALICDAESIADVDLLVTAATGLIDEVWTAEQMQNSLAQYKLGRISDLEGFVNQADYLADQQQEIQDIIFEYSNLIDAAPDKATVDAIYAEAIGLLAEIWTEEDFENDLASYKRGSIVEGKSVLG
jgi:hypothetical protein